MASTHLSLHYHLVFATKNRGAIIAPEWRSRLHEYLRGTIAGLGGFSQGVGGVADHVHLRAGLKPTNCLADVVRELKKASNDGGRRRCDPYRGRSIMEIANRWCRCAQPPANRYNASGVKSR